MRLKWKWKLLVIGTLVSMIYISYKILEPEMTKNNQHSISTVDPKAAEEAIKMSQVVKAMSDEFTPLYDYQLNESPWAVAERWVSDRHIHPDLTPEMGAVLKALSEGNVTSADVGIKGTQLKLTLTLNGKQRVVFKPAWYTRDYVITGTPYEGRDRHNGEIAAFHLGRILQLDRTPLAVGRKLDMNKDILTVATPKLSKTFFDRDGELCFYGRCLYCKGPEDGVCGQAGKMEGTIILWIPSTFTLVKHKHPWARTYRKGVVPKWEERKDWCELVMKHPDYKHNTLILDIIDTAIFDFLIGNADRHMYETFDGFPNSMLIMLDNGKSFSNPDHDELSILAPLYQCCFVRSRIWRRLLALQDGVLSKVLANVLASDPISPILTQQHLNAIDRRVKVVLEQIQVCMDSVGIQAIVMDDKVQGRL